MSALRPPRRGRQQRHQFPGLLHHALGEPSFWRRAPEPLSPPAAPFLILNPQIICSNDQTLARGGASLGNACSLVVTFRGLGEHVELTLLITEQPSGCLSG